MLVVKIVEGDSKNDFEFEVAKILERAAEIVNIQFLNCFSVVFAVTKPLLKIRR